MNKEKTKLVLILGVLIGLLYNAWLLGYVLDNRVALNGMASVLEAVGQPYNWLFVACDVACAVLALFMAYIIFKGNKKPGKLEAYSVYLFLLFSISNAVAALLPLNCYRRVESCGYQGGQVIGFHDVASGISSFSLFVAMVLICIIARRKRILYRLNLAVLSLWSLLGIVIAVPSIIVVPRVEHIGVICQQFFLIFSGVLIYLFAYSFTEKAHLSKLTNKDN